MSALRAPVALLLLLCLLRTLLPEAWVLALHRHEHTTEEAAQAPAFRPTGRHAGKALLSAPHQHCQVEHFYHVPFVLGAPLALPAPVARPGFATAPVPTVATAPWIARQPAQLRGPPRRA